MMMMSGDFCLSFRSVALFYFIRFWFISCLLPLESFVFFLFLFCLLGWLCLGKVHTLPGCIVVG